MVHKFDASDLATGVNILALNLSEFQLLVKLNGGFFCQMLCIGLFALGAKSLVKSTPGQTSNSHK